jgi:DNA-binding response OmpR family regulator
VLRRNSIIRKHPREILRIGNLSINNKTHEVHVKNELVELRTQAYELLRVLIEEKGCVFSREQLLNLVWGYSFAGQTRTVDVHVAQIRRKLRGNTASIETVTGYGYKITERVFFHQLIIGFG